MSEYPIDPNQPIKKTEGKLPPGVKEYQGATSESFALHKEEKQLRESVAHKTFLLPLSEFQIVGESLNKVKFKANVLKPGLSRNGRLYMPDEILEAGRTLAFKPINVNHTKRVVGNVDWAKADKKSHILEVSGTVNKEPEVSLLKMHDPKITGFSVQADFFSAECLHCKKQFPDMEALKEHLISEEKIHNFNYAPRDLIFNGLAICESPEMPGVPSATSYELSEKVKFGTLEEFYDTVNEV